MSHTREGIPVSQKEKFADLSSAAKNFLLNTIRWNASRGNSEAVTIGGMCRVVESDISAITNELGGGEPTYRIVMPRTVRSYDRQAWLRNELPVQKEALNYLKQFSEEEPYWDQPRAT